MIKGSVYRLHTWMSVNEFVYPCSDIIIKRFEYLYYEAHALVSNRQKYQQELENQEEPKQHKSSESTSTMSRSNTFILFYHLNKCNLVIKRYFNLHLSF